MSWRNRRNWLIVHFFMKGESERRMILGEAIGLRAYLQFDLLRVYAPSPAMNPRRAYIYSICKHLSGLC